MRFKYNKILLEDLQLYPSDRYSATVSGVFDFNKTNSFADTISQGSVFGYNKINAKKITLNVLVKNANDIRAHLQLNALLAQTKNKLTIDYDVLGVVELEVYVESKMTTDDSSGKISVTFNAPDPYIYTKQQKLELGVVYAEGLQFPCKFPFKFDASVGGYFGRVENVGYVVAYPVIEVFGPCKWFELTNKTTGETNRIETVLNENDVMIIDNRPFKFGVYLNNVRQNNYQLDTFYTCQVGFNEWEFKRDTPLETVRNCHISLQSRLI